MVIFYGTILHFIKIRLKFNLDEKSAVFTDSGSYYLLSAKCNDYLVIIPELVSGDVVGLKLFTVEYDLLDAALNMRGIVFSTE